jgi:hypothetical protein
VTKADWNIVRDLKRNKVIYDMRLEFSDMVLFSYGGSNLFKACLIGLTEVIGGEFIAVCFRRC